MSTTITPTRPRREALGSMRLAVEALTIRNGDIVLVKTKAPVGLGETQALLKSISRHLYKNRLSKVLALLVNEGVTLVSLDQDEMRNAGWIRAEATDIALTRAVSKLRYLWQQFQEAELAGVEVDTDGVTDAIENVIATFEELMPEDGK